VGGGEDGDEGVHEHGLRKNEAASRSQAQLIQLGLRSDDIFTNFETINCHRLKLDDRHGEEVDDDPSSVSSVRVVLIERACARKFCF
jgi:hypothetical protein